MLVLTNHSCAVVYPPHNAMEISMNADASCNCCQPSWLALRIDRTRHLEFISFLNGELQSNCKLIGMPSIVSAIAMSFSLASRLAFITPSGPYHFAPSVCASAPP